jgi:predicted DNA-binding transcriptional regulator YafY
MSKLKPLLRRILYIDKELRNNKFPNCPEIARKLEISSKTVQRDLDFLRDEMGAPITYCKKENGFFYQNTRYILPTTPFKEDDIFQVLIAEAALKSYGGTPFEPAVRSTLEQFEELLPGNKQAKTKELTDVISFDGGTGTKSDPALYRMLFEAIKNKMPVSIVYFTRGRKSLTRRRIDPYHLRSFRGAWYCIGYCHSRHSVRIFNLKRIRSIQPEKNLIFEVDPSFDPKTFLKNSMSMEKDTPLRKYLLKFSSEDAQWVQERIWHHSQEIKKHLDGSLSLELTVQSPMEMKRWVLSFGKEVEVLRPKDFRNEIRDEIKRSAKLYESQEQKK